LAVQFAKIATNEPTPASIAERLQGFGDTAKRLAPSKADRAFNKLLAERFDIHDVAFRRYDHREEAMRPQQQTNERVELHLNAGPADWQSRLDKLKVYQTTDHRRGADTIYCRPKYDASNPMITVRIDADAHHGEQDARQLIEAIKLEFFGSRLYTEASERGHVAYATFILNPLAIEHGERRGEVWSPSKRAANNLIAELQQALRAFRIARGFQATIEVNGSFTLIAHLEDGHKRLIQRGGHTKLPRCRADEDVIRFAQSTFNEGLIHQIIYTVKQMPVQPAAQHEPQAVPQAVGPAKPIGKARKPRRESMSRQHIADTGDKHKNRWQCVRHAVRQIVGRHFSPDQVSDAEREQIIEQANRLYEVNGFAGADRDSSRDKDFRHCLNKQLATHDPEAMGSGGQNGELCFNEHDLHEAEEIIKSSISKAAIDSINLTNASKLDSARVTYWCLAIALCTFTKNHFVTGSCPTTAVIGMLNYFGIRSNGSHFKVMRAMLMDAGLLDFARKSYRKGSYARDYCPTGPALRLPFIVEAKLVEPELARQTAAMYMQAARGGGNIYSLPQSMKYTGPLVAGLDDDGIDIHISFGAANHALMLEMADRGII
jgi:hypothetical protein